MFGCSREAGSRKSAPGTAGLATRWRPDNYSCAFTPRFPARGAEQLDGTRDLSHPITVRDRAGPRGPSRFGVRCAGGGASRSSIRLFFFRSADRRRVSSEAIKLNITSADAFLTETLGWELHKTNLILLSL